MEFFVFCENLIIKVKLLYNKVLMLYEDIKILINFGFLINRNLVGLFRKVWFDFVIYFGIGG